MCRRKIFWPCFKQLIVIDKYLSWSEELTKKVFISRCYDLLHSNHIEFFREAASFGDLYVALGSDKTIVDLKSRLWVNNESERVSTQPDYLIVNEDGDLLDKRELCEKLGVEYVILNRHPYENLPPRSTTALSQQNKITVRIDLTGDWLP
jgi:hypothetical protein